MSKKIVFAICGCLCLVNVFSQTDYRDEILEGIAQNNNKLKAYRGFIESQKLVNKSGNNLPDPEISAFYLPFGENNGARYTEYQISQSFEFPTVYKVRGKWNELKAQELEIEYAKLRQEVLLKASQLLIDIKILQKQTKIEQKRKEQRNQVFNQIQELYKKEQVGILDLNKAKIAWMQEQFAVEQTKTEIQHSLLILENLNGGNSIKLNGIGLKDDLVVESLESLWKTKKAKDPALQQLNISESVSLQKVKLERNKILPDLTAGYNYQGVKGSNFSGFYGGISIPLWSGRNKVKAAKSAYKFRQSQTKAVLTTEYTTFQKRYSRYQLLLKKYREYQKTMESLDSESLLFNAFKLGELSFMDYYVELKFYRDAIDKMLQMERELYQLRSELLKHQL